MALVLGVGVGLFILGFLWVLCLFLCVALSRAEGAISQVAPVTVILALIVTLILAFFPQESSTEVKEDVTIYDVTFIPRTVMVSICGIMALVGLALFVLFHLFEPQKAHVIRKLRAS